MSKSRGNVINPDDIVRAYGADSMRVYEMFMGPLEVSKPWITAGLAGVSRFLERLWAIGEKPMRGEASPPAPAAQSASSAPPLSGVEAPPRNTPPSPDSALIRLLHRTIKKVSTDTASLNFNPAISQMMIYSAELAKLDRIPRALWEPLVIMASAYAPHLGEELWEKLGHRESVSASPWPVYDESLTLETEATIVVQVNGKIRDKFTAPAGTPKDELEKTARQLPGAVKWTEGHTIVKVIAVPDKLVNIVVK
jgi:leucyl-tRNA synthetase